MMSSHIIHVVSPVSSSLLGIPWVIYWVEYVLVAPISKWMNETLAHVVR